MLLHADSLEYSTEWAVEICRDPHSSLRRTGKSWPWPPLLCYLSSPSLRQLVMMTELPIEFLSHIFITQTLIIMLALCPMSLRSISSSPKAMLFDSISLVRPSWWREGAGTQWTGLHQRQKDSLPGSSGRKAIPRKLCSLQHLAVCLKFCSNTCTVVCILSSCSGWQGIWWKKSWMSDALKPGRDRLTFPEWKTIEKSREGLKAESAQSEKERNYFALSKL